MIEDKNTPPNVIQFPKKCESPVEDDDTIETFDDWGDEFLEFEDWQIDYDLLERKEYDALLKLRKERVEKYPDNEYAQYYLGEAYIYTKQYLKGLHFLSKIHREQPDRIDIQYLILDILFDIGKTDCDFDWKEKPDILHFSDDLITDCFDFLKNNKRPRSIDEVYSSFLHQGYLSFSRRELLDKLIADPRFIVENPDDDVFAFIHVDKKFRQET